MERQSQIVIGPDGNVLAAAGELPTGLVDGRLEDCKGLSPEIRAVAAALLGRLRHSEHRMVSEMVNLDGSGRCLQLIAVEALALRPAATDVRRLLTSKLAVVSSQAATVGVTLTVDAASTVPVLARVDAEKLAWAVTTLVGNALRYMRTGSLHIAGARITVSASHDAVASEVGIEVRDDGPGIPADTVARLFKRDGLNVRGAGLALLLINDIMAAHGGRVEVRSSTDRLAHGTSIRLCFPAR